MTVSIALLSKFQFEENNLALSGGKLFTYAAGTTTKLATYTDSTGGTPNTNPIILDSNGRCDIWLTDGLLYKFVLSPNYDTDPPTSPFWTVDNQSNGSGVLKAALAASIGATLVGYGSGTVASALDADAASIASLVSSKIGRNKLSNGAFNAAVNAGPVALTTSATYATVDSWAVFQNTLAAGASAQVAASLTGFRNALKIGRTAANASTNAIITQSTLRTVDSIPLQNQAITFSFYAKAGANFSGANLNVGVFTGTGTDQLVGQMSSWTGVLTPISTTQNITTSWVRYQFTATLSSTETQVGVRLYYVPSGTAGADDNFYITGAQLELGSTASPFDSQFYREELLRIRPFVPTCGRISNLGATNPFLQCHLVPYDGNLILINGNNEVIPVGSLSSSGGVQATYANCSIDKVLGQTLSTGTLYYIYAYMLAGVMTLDFSTTTWTIDPTYGNLTKTGDPACTLVGLCYPNPSVKTFAAITGGSSYTNGSYPSVALTGGSGSGAVANITVAGGAVTNVALVTGGTRYAPGDVLSATAASIGGTGSGFSIPVSTTTPTTLGSAQGQTIISFFNRIRYILASTISGSTTSSTWVELNANNRLEWVQWSDDLPVGPIAMANWGSTNSGDTIDMGVSLNSTVTPNGYQGHGQVSNTSAPNINLHARALNPGDDAYFMTSLLAQRGGSGTASITGSALMLLDGNAV